MRQALFPGMWLAVAVATAVAFARDPQKLPPADAARHSEHFESRVRPILVQRCQKCHAGDGAKGGLRLDSVAGVRRGGDTGPAIDANAPDKSLLLAAVRHENGLKMPPDGKLSAGQIADLATWIKDGAFWPEGDAVTSAAEAKPAEPKPVPPNDSGLAKSLQLWLRADDLALNDGELVHVWPDQSGNGRDVAATKGVRSNGVGLPARFVKESKLQRRPGVRFETTTGMASSPHLPVEIRGDAGLSMLVVVHLEPHDAQPPYDGIVGLGDPANPGRDPGKPLAALLQINRGENHALHFAGGWNHDASLGSGSFAKLYGQTVLLTVTKQPGPMRATTRFFVNGQPIGKPGDLAGRDTVPDIRHRTDIGVYLGKAVSWAGSIRGDIGEVAVFNKPLSDKERVSVEAYLGDKFGLVLTSQAHASRPDALRAPFTPQERNYWAYQPVRKRTPPRVKDAAWATSPLDRFVQAKRDVQGLAPSPRADRRTLLRRVTFDLTGLPPTPEETDSFLQDGSPQAFEKVVDRLLASPRYGERWGRHWLDVVRYAESTANDANAVMRYAWRYRDYVIDAFNRDLPYDQFLIEQLAGDLLPPSLAAEENARRTIATGYLMIGPKALAETDKEQSRLDIVDDQIDVTGRAMLGLTLACARCHDHKFDAIRTADYYALAGIFRSTEPFQNENRNATMWWEFPVSLGPGREPITVMAPKESVPRNLRVHVRGNRFTLGPTVPRGIVRIVDHATGGMQSAVDAVAPNQLSSGRLELARWVASPRNPLTARVMVNRLWQHHFGQGLVATSDNFGTRGQRPSHPELLDWLAAEFIERGWSVKAMHRLILLSSSYQQSGQPSATARQADPDRRWLSSFPRRRLAAEELRDAVLAVSGRLDHAPGAEESGEFLVSKAENIGAMIMPNRVASDDPFYSTYTKRSVYLPVVRNMLPDVLAVFGAADPNDVAAVRNETTVPAQALFLLNSPFLREQSQRFAQRLFASAPGSDRDRIDAAHRLALGRSATAAEVDEALTFLTAYQAALARTGQPRPKTDPTMTVWQSYCQSLFCLTEFLYVE